MVTISEDTKVKFHLKQIWAILGVIVVIAGVVLNFRMQLQAMDIRQTNTELKLTELQALIEQNRNERVTQIRELKEENSTEHSHLMEKLDNIYDILSRGK